MKSSKLLAATAMAVASLLALTEPGAAVVRHGGAHVGGHNMNRNVNRNMNVNRNVNRPERQRQSRWRRRLSWRRLSRRLGGAALSLGAGRRDCRRRGDRRHRRRHGGRLGAPAAASRPLLVLYRRDPAERLLGQLPISWPSERERAASSDPLAQTAAALAARTPVGLDAGAAALFSRRR